jgi:phosphatidate cytidylyltransferase
MPQSSLWPRLISSLILWALTLTLVVTGWNSGAWLLLSLFGLLGQWEFYEAQEAKGLDVYKRCGVTTGATLFLATWWFLVHDSSQAHFLPDAEGAIFAIIIIGALCRLVFSAQPHTEPINGLALTLFGFFYVPYLFSYVAKVGFYPGSTNSSVYVLLYLLAVTKFSDCGAYLLGSLIGRHKMIPRISPGKTWEGLVGGVLASLGISLLLVYLLPQKLSGLSWNDAIWLGLLLPLAAVIGDLAESVVKRDAHLKDSGRTIPGIGGVLDLIDSILFTAPVFYFYLVIRG